MDPMNADTLYGVFSQVIRFHFMRMHTLLEKIGVYPGQHPLLYILGRQDGLSQREIGKLLHIKAATITVMVNRMEKAKLVERRSDGNDQRLSRVYLTEEGRRVLSEVEGTIKKIEGECFKNLTAEEQVILRRLLMQVRANLAETTDTNLCR